MSREKEKKKKTEKQVFPLKDVHTIFPILHRLEG